MRPRSARSITTWSWRARVRLARAGAQNFVLISSVGAAMGSRSFYLRTKGEIEHNVEQLGFSRVDILRPGLLRGMRGSDRRLRERLGIALSPLTDRILQGPARKFRSLDAGLVARAALQFVQHDAEGDFVHVNDAIHRAARATGGQCMRQSAPAALRNREPIAEVLREELPDHGTVLEIASGTGEHALYFAQAFPHLDWQPSDADPDALRSIAAWREDALAAGGAANLREPLRARRACIARARRAASGDSCAST